MGLIENLKEAADLAKKVGDINLYRQIVELEGEVIELTRKMRSVEEENENLKHALDVKKDVQFKAPFYYAADDESPYCPKCWEVDHKLVHVPKGMHTLGGYMYGCPNCKSNYLHK
jgi:hypothetical protein